MDLDVSHRARTGHQVAEALLELATTGPDCSPIHDSLRVMLVRPLPKDECKGRTKYNNGFDDCNNSSATAKDPGVSAVYAITTPRAETTTSMLMKHMTEQASDAFSRQVADPVGTFCSVYQYERHGLLVCTASLSSAIQIWYHTRSGHAFSTW